MDTSSYLKTSIKGLKQKSSSEFLLDIRVDKKRYRKVITGLDIKEASEALKRFREDIIKSLTIEADINTTVDKYWELFKQVKGWKPDHERAMSNYYDKNIKQHLGKMKVSAVKPRHLTAFNASLKHLSARYQKKAYEILKPLFDMAVEDEIILSSPIKRIHIPVRNQLAEKKVITNASVRLRYLNQALHIIFNSNEHLERFDYQCSIRPMHLALFLFGLNGRRLGEVLALTWDDINLIDDTYIIRGENSKVDMDMVFKLHDDVSTALRNIDTDRKGRVFDIRYIDHHYPIIRKVSGLPEFSYHWMRNLIVSALASEGVEPIHLSAMLGHTDGGTLKKYLTMQRQASTKITNEVTTRLFEFDD